MAIVGTFLLPFVAAWAWWPRPPGPAAPENATDPRLTFATSFANRVWAHFMGIGIVEPVDDFRVSNPASNPELLAALGQRFTDSKYDLKTLVRDICNSRTYQRTTQRNPSNSGDERNFAHALVRRIKAENLLDSISVVTDTKDKFDGLPVGARAVQTGASVDAFSSCSRKTRLPFLILALMAVTVPLAAHAQTSGCLTDTTQADFQAGVAHRLQITGCLQRLAGLGVGFGKAGID